MLLIPFGTDACIRVKNQGELNQNTEHILHNGLWNLVHVLKSRGRYPGEY